MIPSNGRSDHCHLIPSGINSTIYNISIEAVIISLILHNLSNDAFRMFDLECVAITGAILQYFLRLSNNLIKFYGGRASLASRCIPDFLPLVVYLLDRPTIIVLSHPPFNNFQQEWSNLLIACCQDVNKIREHVFCPCTGTIRRTDIEVGEHILWIKVGVWNPPRSPWFQVDGHGRWFWRHLL